MMRLITKIIMQLCLTKEHLLRGFCRHDSKTTDRIWKTQA